MKTLLVVLLMLSFVPVGVSGEAPPTPIREDPAVLDCKPGTLSPGGVLTLKLGPGHGSELSIRREADQRPFFLVVQSPPAEMKSLMSRAEFAATKLVKLTTDVTGFAWVKDGKNEKIFTLPGTYTIYVSEILESEAGGYTCSVTFRTNAR